MTATTPPPLPADLAEGLKLGEYLRLGEGEMKSGGHRRPSILADALEAIFAAVFLDAGFEAAKAVIDQLYASSIASLDPARALKDPKTALQEWAQARRLPLPVYHEVDREGPPHAPVFVVDAILKGHDPARGRGGSKREAERLAAMNLLERLNGA